MQINTSGAGYKAVKHLQQLSISRAHGVLNSNIYQSIDV
jgi:hypothetical protein